MTPQEKKAEEIVTEFLATRDYAALRLSIASAIEQAAGIKWTRAKHGRPDNTRCVLCANRGDVSFEGWYLKRARRWFAASGLRATVTHWTELPAPPREGE